jgi:hypothetical protein
MALYSRKEFIKLCGYEWDKSAKGKIGMWVARGKVIEQPDGKIDDTNPKNRDWILVQKDKAAFKQGESESIEQEDDSIPQFEEPGGSIERKLKAQQIEKLKVDTRIAELKEAKMKAETMEVDRVKTLFRIYNHAIITAQKDGIEELLTNISSESRWSNTQLAKARGKMVSILNNAVDKAVVIAEKQLWADTDFPDKGEAEENDEK